MTTIEYAHALVKKVRESEQRQIHTNFIGAYCYTLKHIPFPDVRGIHHWELWMYTEDNRVVDSSPTCGNDMLQLLMAVEKYRGIVLQEIVPLEAWQ